MIPIIRLSLLESARRQVHLLLLFLGVLLLIVPSLVNAFNMALPDRVVKDIGLTLMGLYGVALTLFLSCSAVPGEVERHTIYPLLARPVSRLQYLIARFITVVILVGVSQVVLCACIDFSLWVFLKHGDPRLYIVALELVMEDMVLAAGGILFSTMGSPVLSAVVCLFCYIIGGLSPVFINFFLEDPSSKTTGFVARSIKMLLPQFDFFQIKDAVVHGEPLAASFVGATVAYGLAWVVLLLLLGGISFERRDL